MSPGTSDRKAQADFVSGQQVPQELRHGRIAVVGISERHYVFLYICNAKKEHSL